MTRSGTRSDPATGDIGTPTADRLGLAITDSSGCAGGRGRRSGSTNAPAVGGATGLILAGGGTAARVGALAANRPAVKTW